MIKSIGKYICGFGLLFCFFNLSFVNAETDEWIDTGLGFEVMKYEARSSTVDGRAISTPLGNPWVNVTQAQASTACTAVGAHLITNQEWTALARHIAAQPSNWSNGTVGSGFLSRGYTASTANSSDGFTNTKVASYSGSGYEYNTAADTVGSSGLFKHKRTHVLANGQVIWDLSGNVYEWNNNTCTPGTGIGYWYNGTWVEWNNANLNDYERKIAGPYSSIYTSTQNAGRYYGCVASGNAFIRGGYWSSELYGGVFATSLSDVPSGSHDYTGFRCARSLLACGSSNGGSFTNAPTGNLCAGGTANIVTVPACTNEFDMLDGVLTISSNGLIYCVSGSASGSSNNIVIGSGITTTINFVDDTIIDMSSRGKAAIALGSNSNLTLNALDGAVITLKGGNASGLTKAFAGINVPATATLLIRGSGTFNIYGGNGNNYSYRGGGGAGAGIGGNGGDGGGVLVTGYGYGGQGLNGNNGEAAGTITVAAEAAIIKGGNGANGCNPTDSYCIGGSGGISGGAGGNGCIGTSSCCSSWPCCSLGCGGGGYPAAGIGGGGGGGGGTGGESCAYTSEGQKCGGGGGGGYSGGGGGSGGSCGKITGGGGGYATNGGIGGVNGFNTNTGGNGGAGGAGGSVTVSSGIVSIDGKNSDGTGGQASNGTGSSLITGRTVPGYGSGAGYKGSGNSSYENGASNGTLGSTTSTAAFGEDSPWEWYCINGELSSSKCTAYRLPPTCGTNSGESFFELPTTNVCSFGTAIMLDNDFSKIKQITISNPSSSTLIDYPLLLTIPYDSDMNTDFSDLRFISSDGETELSYWIESKTDSSSAKVWVKVPRIPIYGIAIYMYYGNPSATTLSNGNDVFTFFDDFTGTTIDTAKWTEVDGSNYISQNGSLIISNGTGAWGGTGIYTNTNFSRGDLVVEGKYFNTCAVGTTYKGSSMLWIKDTSTSVNYTIFPNAFYTRSDGSTYIWTNYENGTNYTPNGTLVCNTQYKFRQIIKASGGATTQYSSDDGNTWTTARDSTFYSGSFKVGVTNYQGGLIYIDDVNVRPYTVDSPIATISGTEYSTSDTPNGSWEWYCTRKANVGSKCAADQISPTCGASNGGTFATVPTTGFCSVGSLGRSDWLDYDYSKRKPVTITNSSGSALSDYQVKLVIAYNSEMQADFDDLRFTSSDGKTELNYWLESKTDSSTATVWVKVPSISTADTIIYMYFGNSEAVSTSSGNNTFAFFDDFNDLSKWNTTPLVYNGGTGSITASGGIATIASTNTSGVSFTSLSTMPNRDMRIRLNMTYQNQGTSSSQTRIVITDNTSVNPSTANGMHMYPNSISFSANAINNTAARTYNSTTPTIYDFSSSANADLLIDNVSFASLTNTAPALTNMYFRLWSYYNSSFKLDWFLAREYSAVEPVVVIGDTEDVGAVTVSGSQWEWYCFGGEFISSKCIATQSSGTCGSADGVAVRSLTEESPDLCPIGSTLTWNGLTSNVYNWICGGASCSANQIVDGECGTANRNYSYSTESYGTDTYCTNGTVSSSPAFPNPGSSVTWTCSGINGGEDDSCIAVRSDDFGAVDFMLPSDLVAIGLSEDQKKQCLWCNHYYADSNPDTETILVGGKGGSGLAFEFTYNSVLPEDVMTGYEFVLSEENVLDPDTIIDPTKKIVIEKNELHNSGEDVTVSGFSVSRDGFDSGVIIDSNSSKKQLGYGKTYNWWVKVKTASSESGWIPSRRPFTTTDHQWPRLGVAIVNANAIKANTSRYCSTVFAPEGETADPCLSACWIKSNEEPGITNLDFSFSNQILQSSQLDSSSWKCSVCYNSNGDPILCQNATTTLGDGEMRFEWTKGGTAANVIFPSSDEETGDPNLTPFGDDSNGIYASNPFITVVTSDITNRVRLKIRGSECPLQMSPSVAKNIRPIWVEK